MIESDKAKIWQRIDQVIERFHSGAMNQIPPTSLNSTLSPLSNPHTSTELLPQHTLNNKCPQPLTLLSHPYPNEIYPNY